MMKWRWYTILLPLLLIGVTFLVWHIYKRFYTKEEGFQTTTFSRNIQSYNSQVFHVQVAGKEEILTRTAGAAVCASIGARTATYDEIVKAATDGYINMCDKWGWITMGYTTDDTKMNDSEKNTKYSICNGSVKTGAPVISREAVERLCGIVYESGDDTKMVQDASLLINTSTREFIQSNIKSQYIQYLKTGGDSRGVSGLLARNGTRYYITEKDRKYADSACARDTLANDNYKRVTDVFCYGEKPTQSSVTGLTISPATNNRAGRWTTEKVPRPYFNGTASSVLPSLTSSVYDISGAGANSYTIFDMAAIQLQAKLLMNDYKVLKETTAAAETAFKNDSPTDNYIIQKQRIRQGFELYRAIGSDERGDFSNTNYERYFTEHLAIINNDINNVIDKITANPLPTLLQLKRVENSEILKVYSLTPSGTSDGSCLPIFMPYPRGLSANTSNIDFGFAWEVIVGGKDKKAVKVDPPPYLLNSGVIFFDLQVNGVHIRNENGDLRCRFKSDDSTGTLTWGGFREDYLEYAKACNKTDVNLGGSRNMGLHRCFDPNLSKNYSRYTCAAYNLPQGGPLLLKYLLSNGSFIDYSTDWFKYIFPNDNIKYYAVDKVNDGFVCPPNLVNFVYGDFRSDFLANPNTWDFSPRLADSNTALINTFKSQKDNSASKLLWRKVPYKGTMTALNKTEAVKSVSLSIYFSLQSGAGVEQQIRVDSTDPTKLFMSPTSSAMQEVKGKLTQTQPVQYVIAVDNEAKTNNDIMCSVELTPNDLFYIPYHASRFMAKWADTRADRLKKFQESQVLARTGTRQAEIIATNVVQTTFTESLRKPLFDMASVSTPGATGPKTYLTKAEKQELLNRMAQLYYDLNDGSTSIDTILDVYQVGDTLYDIRFKQRAKVSQTTRNAISSLTATYNNLRTKRMSVADQQSLEIDYQRRLSEYYDAENRNTTGSANCTPVRARYARIEAATAGKRIRLSQVIVIGDDGTNLATGGAFTYFSTLNCYLSPTAYPTELFADPVYAFDGSRLTGSEATKKINQYNDASRQKKLGLLIDGVVKPRAAPEVYESLYSSFTRIGGADKNNDFLLLDLGTENFVNAVKLVLPEDGNSSTSTTGPDTSYKVTLLNYYKQSVTGGEERTINVTTSPVAVFVTGDDACPRDLLYPYRTARFYASTSQLATEDRSLSTIRFCGFTEDIADTSDPTQLNALSFNPLYNGGFVLDLNAQSGNQNYKPTISFTKNFTETQKALNCADATKLQEILREFTMSLGQANFLGREDIQNLPESVHYRPEVYDYYVSSIQKSATISSDTCGIQWYEQRYERTTNTTDSAVLRQGTFKMTADTENWYSPRILYDVLGSRLYNSEGDYNTANPGKGLVAVAGAPIKVELPLPADRTLDDGNGACPPKRCSDLDVIKSIIGDYNSIEGATKKVLRVNKAVTANFRRCDFEVVMADYSAGATANASSEVTNISTMITLDVTNGCKYKIATGTMPTSDTGKFVTDSTPYLTKIYTYVNEFVEPIYGTLKKNITDLIGLAQAQDATGTGVQNIRTSLDTYRKDTLAAYGSLKTLSNKMCLSPDTSSRCYDPAILNSFINYYSNQFWGTQRIQTIQRAATASDTECDFTFDTKDIGYNAATRGIAEGTPTTRAMRCRMAPDPLACAFTLSTATYTTEEVFSVTPADGPVLATQREVVCQALGARVARTIDLDAAYKAGASWTTPGWVADALDAYAPVAGVGVSTTFGTDPSLKFAVNCFGFKPAVGGGILPFAPGQEKMPIRGAIPGSPCIEIIPVEPTIEDLANVGLKPNTAMRTATPAAMSTMTTIYSEPYAVRDVAKSPIDYIDCQSTYAKNALFINNFGREITKIAQISISSCAVNGTNILTFKKETGRNILVFDRRLPIDSTYTPSMDVTTSVNAVTNLTLTNPIRTDIRCMDTDLVTATGLRTIVGGRRLNDTTCEYRVTSRDDLPFGATYKRVGFYNEGTTIAIQEFADATPLVSPWVYQPPLSTNLSSEFTRLAAAFRTQFNTKYYTKVTATELQFQQRVGKMTAAAYLSTEDAVIFQGEYVQIGPIGELDIREFSPQKLFKVVFRKTFSTNSIYVYSMELITTIPTGATGLTPYSGDIGDDMVKSTEDLLRNQNKFRVVKFTNTGGSAIELYRINFFTNLAGRTQVIDSISPLISNLNDTIVGLSRAYVTLTDPNRGGSELYDPKFFADGPRQCNDETYRPLNKGGGEYYDKSLDPITKFSTCTLNTGRLPAASQSLYSYTMTANLPCRIGYWPDVEMIVDDKTELDKQITKIPPPLNRAKYYVKKLNQIYRYDATGRTFGNPLSETPQCILRYRFSDVINTFRASDNLNNYTPRLVLRSGQSIIIRFNEYLEIGGYAIVGGARDRTPTSWKLEGSINALNWAPIDERTRASTDLPRDFWRSSIIRIPTSSETISYNINATQDATAISPIAAAEGFQNYTAPTWQPLRLAEQTPLQFTPNFHRTRPYIQANAQTQHLSLTPEKPTETRMTWFRFRVLETRDPASKYVTISDFRFYTAAGGPWDMRGVKVSNLGGVRRSPREGPEALLTPNGRWVDYSKSPLLFRFESRESPFIGYRFSPVPGEADAAPAKWLLEGSYDGRTWTILHDSRKAAVGIQGTGSTIHRFLNQV